jgi:propionyl-CoA synthetase
VFPAVVADFDDCLHSGQAVGGQAAVPLLSSDPLYLLYTSGTTGTPKGIIRDNASTITLAWSISKFMRLSAGEVYFSAADVGW